MMSPIYFNKNFYTLPWRPKYLCRVTYLEIYPELKRFRKILTRLQQTKSQRKMFFFIRFRFWIFKLGLNFSTKYLYSCQKIMIFPLFRNVFNRLSINTVSNERVRCHPSIKHNPLIYQKTSKNHFVSQNSTIHQNPYA